MTRKQAIAEVKRVRETLAEPTEKQMDWMKIHSLAHKIYYTSKSKCWCTHCGHFFSVDELTENGRCPHCGEQFPMIKSGKQLYNDNAYCAILTTRGDWQILRYFSIECHTYKENTKLRSANYGQSYDITECLRKWCNPTEKVYITERLPLKFMPNYCRIPYRTWDPYNNCVPQMRITRNECAGGYYGDDWNSEWFIKSVYPYGAILPYFRKRGLNIKTAEEISIDKFAEQVDEKSWAETLVKTGQYKLANGVLYDSGLVRYHEKNVKIALRHGFNFNQLRYLRDYEDYLNQLEELGMDTHSPKYLCPADFTAEHARLTALLRARRERQARIAERERLLTEIERNKKGKAAMEKRAKLYAGLIIKGYGMEIRPLLSAQQYIDEGDAMHHCVGTYVNNTTSLILSARMDGKRVETIELDTKSWKIVQSRAVCNGTSPQHEQIISLMKRNIPTIRQMSMAA